MSTFGYLDGDLRWFCARMKAMAPDSDIPYDMGGLTDSEYVFFDEKHNINYTFLRHFGIFRIEVEVTLPPVGGELLWREQLSRLFGWCGDMAIAVEPRICPNGQVGMAELRMSKGDATLENIGSLRQYLLTNICTNLTAYAERYVGVRYEETGHLFYAYLYGFDIRKAFLVQGRSVEIYSSEAERGQSVGNSEEMGVCLEMNRIDMIEPRNLIPEETFRRAWERYVSSTDIRECC